MNRLARLTAILVAPGVCQNLPAATILSEDFENGLGGWLAGDNNASGTPAYWGIVNSAFGGEVPHSGTNKAYCAAVGYAGTTTIPTYQNYMTSYLLRSVELSSYDHATLSFWYKIPGIETNYDLASVLIDNNLLWSSDRAQFAWTQVTLSLDQFVGAAHNLTFQFSSDSSITYEGWYVDDVLVTDAYTPPPPPTNNNFSAALTMVGAMGELYGSNRGATAEPGEPDGGFNATNSVWYRWTSPTNGQVTISTERSTFDTILCIYTGTTLTGLTQVACDDNGGSNNTSRVVFDAAAGVTYRVAVRGATNASGNVLLSWSQPNGLGPDLLPDVMLWTNASQNFLYGWYLDYSQIPGHTLLRVSTATPNIGAGPLELIGSSTTPGVYQRIYRADGSYHDRYAGTFTFHPSHGHLHFDNWLNFHLRSVAPGGGVGPIVVSGDKTSFAIIDLMNYDSSLPGHPSSSHYSGGLVQGLSVGWADVYSASLADQWIDITGIAPGQYWLEAIVDPAGSILERTTTNNANRILIQLGATAISSAPPNDHFTNAIVISGVTAGQFGATFHATKEPGEPDHGGFAGGASIWYSWTAPSNMNVTITTAGSDFDTLLGVYTGTSVSALSLVVSNDDNGSLRTSLVNFNASAGTLYRIAVDGYSGAMGNVQLNVNPAWNDNYSNCLTLSGLLGTVTGSSRGATRQSGEPLHAGVQGTNSLWYCWTAPTNALMTFDTLGSGFDTLLAVYTGSALTALTPIASDDNSGPTNTSRVAFNAVSNTTYMLAVDGPSGAAGLVRLNWLGPTAPFILVQPLATNLPQGSALRMTVVAGGSSPLTYQWQHAGDNFSDDLRISGTTNATLSIGKVLFSDAGPYTVVVSNVYGAVTSAPANLIVLDNPRAIYLDETNVAIGGTISLPVQMQAQGDEHALSFSLLFDPTLLTYRKATNGLQTAAASLTLDTTSVADGKIGLSLAFPPGVAVPAGTESELARVLFDVNPAATNDTQTSIGFGDLPQPRFLVSTNGATLSALYAAGLLTLQQVPTVASARLINGQFQVAIRGVPGRSYLIEATDSLAPANWQPAATNQTDLSGVFIYTNIPTTAPGSRFYRARLLQ